MAKWPKYKLHDKESKTQISQRGEMNRRFLNIIVTEIREQLNDLIKSKLNMGL